MTETAVDEGACPTILMVDDAPANLGIVVETLEQEGFRVLVAEDGDEALQRAILVQPDLILLDIMMPDLDGFAVCRRLKELDHTRHIPVIFMTALVETPHKVAGFQAGAVDYLTKPLQLDEVVARVKTHLQLRAMQDQLQEQNAELQRYRDGLEQQVAQRTAELSASNRRLQQEIAERRQHEQLESLRLRIFERLAQGGALVEVLDLVVAYVEQAYGDLLGSIMLTDAEGKQLFVAAAPSMPTEYSAAIDGIDIADGIGSCGTAVWRSETVIVDDIRSHPHWRNYKSLALKHGLLACWSEPILDSSGKVLGTFCIYRREPGRPSAAETELVRQASHLAAIALERKRAEIMLRENEQRYREIFDNVSDILYLLEVSEDRDFRYIEVNPAFEKMVGLPRSTIVGSHAGTVPASGTAQRLAAQYRRCLEAGEQIDEEVELELAGGTRNYHATLTPVYDADGRIRLITGISRDITERRQVEALRHAREQEFRALVEHSPDTIIRYDRHCRRIYVNPAFEQLAGAPASAWLGKTPVEASVLSHMASPYQDMLRQVVATGTPAAMQLDLPSLHNRPLHHHVRAAPEFDRDGQVASVLVIGWDITELKEAERRLEESRAQLRELAFRRETAREQERKRIAREMHDELGQRLTALRMDIAVLRLRFGKSHPDLQQQVQSTMASVDSLIQVVRNVASSLRPSALDMGIASALEWLADEFRQRSGIQCELRLSPGEIELAEQQATAIFRLVQESLTNVTRHARAQRVTILLEREEHHYLLQISDDGQGFNADEHRKKSFGLIGMRERVLMLGGELSIHTAPGKGVTIQARIPIARG